MAQFVGGYGSQTFGHQQWAILAKVRLDCQGLRFGPQGGHSVTLPRSAFRDRSGVFRDVPGAKVGGDLDQGARCGSQGQGLGSRSAFPNLGYLTHESCDLTLKWPTLRGQRNGPFVIR